MPTLRRSSRGKKRYSEPEDEAYAPRHINKEELNARPVGYGLRQRPKDDVELLMECEEEALLPAQIEAFKRDMEEFEAAKRRVKVAKDEQLRQQQQQQQVLRQQQAVAAAQKKVVAPTSAPQPDVIIVGESPPKQTPNSQPAQPTVSSGARLVNPVPQQVYKFVNLPGQTIANANNQWVVRPLMQVMPQQNQPRVTNQVNIQKSPFMPRQISPQPFPSTQNANYGSRRPVSYNTTEQQQQYVNPQRKKVRRPEDDCGALVPLDEYYYGKKEGDPTYLEDKGEHRFKCWYCSKMLYNNVKAMMHMQGHIDSEKQQNLDLSDLTQCKHCYKQFDTPFEMQTHIEKVHMNNANVLLCRICEKDHESRQSLTNHMRQNHNACEMPYICQLCHFRSSMYSDVVDHFKKKHEHSDYVLCLYCLKMFHIKFVSQGWGQTQNYYHHLLRHQSKSNAKKCQLCKLTFFNSQDVKAHRKKDHMPNQKGVIGMNAKYTTPDQVMIRVPESGLQPKQQGVKSLNAPAVSKVSEHRGLRFPQAVMELYCFECKMVMATNDHYKKYIQCSMCRFATSCSFAYANHMMGFHSGQMTSLSLNIPWDRPLPHLMYCLCGFGSKYGNKIANHLVFCTKRSCYKDKPAIQPKDDKGDEEQDPRRKPGASILDVLGLVKKPNIVSTDMLGEESEDRRFESPEREQTPSPEPSQSDVPEELTGAQKWLTVKLKDDKTPTKSAVFGAEEEGRPFTPEPEDRSGDGEDISALVQSALEAEDDESRGEAGDKSKGETGDKESIAEGKTRSEESKESKGKTGDEESIAETNTQGSESRAETGRETKTDKPAEEGETVREAEKCSEESCLETESRDKTESRDETESKNETEPGVFKGETDTSGGIDVNDKPESMEVEETSEEKEVDEETESKGETEIANSSESGQTEQDQEGESPAMDSEKNVIDEVEDEAAKDDAKCDNAEASKDSVQEDMEADNLERAGDATEMEVSQSSECDRDKDGEEITGDSEVNRDSSSPGLVDEGQCEDSVERQAEEEMEGSAQTEDSGQTEESEQTKMDSQGESTEERQGDSSADRPEDSSEKRPDTPVERPDDSQQKEELSRAGDEDISQHEESSGRLEESETLPDTDSKTIGEDRSEMSARPEDSEEPVEDTGEEKQSTDKGTSRSLVSESYDEPAETEEKTDSIASSSKLVTPELPVSETSSDKQSSNPLTSDKSAKERSDRSRESDREKSRDHYRDRSDDRDRSRDRDRWDRSRDSERSDDRSRDHDRAYDRDRDRRDHHRSDRDRHGYGGGYRDRYDDRRHQNDNRNYNRYQGGHQRDYHGGYHGNQSQYQGGGYRDNYGNQRDRYGQGNRGHGNYGNRDYRGRGQGYHNKY